MTSSFRGGASCLLSILLVLGSLGFIEVIASRHNVRFDLTRQKSFSLSPHTTKILESLDRDIEAVVFYRRDSRQEVVDLLNLYSLTTSRFSYRLYDLDRNPGKAEKFGAFAYRDTFIVSENWRKKLPNLSEDDLTNAIIKVSQTKRRICYFLTGHGENDPFDGDGRNGYSGIRRLLEVENFEVRTLFLANRGRIPADAFLLVVSGPKKDLLPRELGMISLFIKEGGKVVFMLDPTFAPNMIKYLDQYNIIPGDNIIVDKESKLLGWGDLVVLTALYKADHPITKGFTIPCIFPVVRSIEIKEESNHKEYEIHARDFVRTGPASWAESNIESAQEGNAAFDRGEDAPGPVPVVGEVVVSVKQDIYPHSRGEETKYSTETKAGISAKRPGRIAVFGDSDFVKNFYLNILGNKDLFLNTVNWLAEEMDDISVRPRGKPPPQLSPLFLTDRQGRTVFWMTTVLEPSVVLLIGIMVWARRRIRG